MHNCFRSKVINGFYRANSTWTDYSMIKKIIKEKCRNKKKKKEKWHEERQEREKDNEEGQKKEE